MIKKKAAFIREINFKGVLNLNFRISGYSEGFGLQYLKNY